MRAAPARCEFLNFEFSNFDATGTQSTLNFWIFESLNFQILDPLAALIAAIQFGTLLSLSDHWSAVSQSTWTSSSLPGGPAGPAGPAIGPAGPARGPAGPACQAGGFKKSRPQLVEPYLKEKREP